MLNRLYLLVIDFEFFICLSSAITEPMDILVGFDTSDQMTTKDYNDIKAYLQTMIKNYDISKDKTRIGLINFGARQKIVLSLDEGDTEKKLVSAIKGITKMGKFYFHFNLSMIVFSKIFSTSLLKIRQN